MSDCVCALLSLASPRAEPASPKSSRSRESVVETVESRPVKILKRQDSREQICRVEGVASSRGVAQPSLQPGAEAMINRWVELKRGKYKGRRALIVGTTAKKFRVRVTGVELQLEFYPSMFKEIESRSTTPLTLLQNTTAMSQNTTAVSQNTTSQRMQAVVAQSRPVGVPASHQRHEASIASSSQPSSQASPMSQNNQKVVTRRLPPQLMRKLQPPQLLRLGSLETTDPKTSCREGCTLGEQLVSPIRSSPGITAV